MPIYDYKCPCCGWEGEVRHSLKLTSAPCPECKRAMKKVIRGVPLMRMAGGGTRGNGSGRC